MLKISPFYNLINTFSSEKLNAYAIEKKEPRGRSYFLIKLNIEKTKNILPAPYTLKEAHFSIDEMYSNAHGYTPIHYTQCYSAPGQDDIMIHGYLDLEGKYKHCQATPLTLTQTQEEQLKTQITDAMPVLKRLFIEQKLYQTQLKKEATLLEEELSRLSRGLDPKKTRQLYIQKSYQFIKAIQTLNDYSIIQDSQDIIVADRIKNLEAIQECLSFPLETKQAETESPAFCASTPLPVPPFSQKEKLAQLYKLAFEKFNINVEAFQAPNQDIESLTQCVKAIKEQLFLIYNFPDEMIIKKHHRKITRVLKKIEDFEQKQYAILIALALEGNVTAFKAQFSLCSEHLNTDFYTLLVDKLIETKAGTLQTNILEIMDYLSEHDKSYRAFISKLSQEKRYTPSKKVIQTICTTPETKKDFERYHISLLYKLYTEDKLNLFSAFLRQGACTDTWGLTSPEEKYPSLTLFYMIAMLARPNYLEYLKKLLQYGTDPNVIFTKEKLADLNKDKLKFPSLFRKMRALSPQGSNFELSTSIAGNENFPNIVELLSAQSKAEGLKIILPKACLGDLARYFSALSNDKRIRKYSCISDTYYTDYASNQEEAYRRPKNEILRCFFISSVLYPCASNTVEDNQYLETLYQRMQLIGPTLRQRIALLSVEAFDSQYQDLLKRGQIELQSSKEDYIEAYNSFLGCETLLMEYVSQSITCPKKQRIFIQKYSKTLYSKIILSLKMIDHEASKAKQSNYQSVQIFYSQKLLGEALIVEQPAPILVARITTQETDNASVPEYKQAAFAP